jgi:hypothetical protein
MTDEQILTMNFLVSGVQGKAQNRRMKAWRASLLRFRRRRPCRPLTPTACSSPGPTPRAGGGHRGGDHGALAGASPACRSTHLPGRILAPGFVDLHIHYPQTDVIGSPAEGLLPWLEHYTFPHEARFADADLCRRRGHLLPGRARAQRRDHRADLLPPRTRPR